MDRAIDARDATAQLRDPIANISDPANVAAAIEAGRHAVKRETQPMPWSVRVAGAALAALAGYMLLIAMS